MAEAKPWEAVFDRIRALYWPEQNYPPKPTEAELDAAERQLGFKFPLSYRAFAGAFGLSGLLCCSLPRIFPLKPPPRTNKTHWWSSVSTATEFYHTYDWHGTRGWDDELPSPEFLKRVIIFAQDGGYHDWAFDPAELTNEPLRECRIYDINRQTHAEPIASSFGEWLAWVRDNYTFDREEEEGKEPEFAAVYKPNTNDPQPIDYFPGYDYKQRKVKPAKSNVKLWLTANNSTARNLALSIRDEGHADAFPVLADALQDAGCAHADLLDACRTGDPDIDGKWVLQVLLGNT